MSGIYIPGMEIPTSCGDCPLRHEARDGDECYFGASLTEYQKRPDDCPLVPVPPHGRLGDLDELHKEAVRRSEKAGTYDSWYNCADRVISAFDIENAPTIIEADESDMDSFIRIFEEDDEEDGMDSFIRILED